MALTKVGKEGITGISNSSDATAITIDSSENVMIGTTDTVPSNNGAGGDAGVAISPDGVFRAARSGNVSLDINRMDSDGEIAAFRKDGTTVGSIGAVGTDVYLSSPSGNDAGVRLGNNIIRPCTTTGGSRDNAIDLGKSDTRFKDLYLGGNLYLGGTGSANALDDYETGTFTPSYTSGTSSATYSVQTGRYTKIGNRVFFQFELDGNSITANTNHLYIGGLPFTSNNGQAAAGALISYSGGVPQNIHVTGVVFANSTNIGVYKYSDGGAVAGNTMALNGGWTWAGHYDI